MLTKEIGMSAKKSHPLMCQRLQKFPQTETATSRVSFRTIRRHAPAFLMGCGVNSQYTAEGMPFLDLKA